MKSIVLICLSIVVLTAAQDYKELDDIDFVAYLNDDKLLEANYKCLISSGPCSPADAALKNRVQEIADTQCEKCSPKLKAELDAISVKLIKEHSDWLAALSKIFDPTGESLRKFQERTRQH